MDTNKIFEALPHVNSIWVTKDGHFHLHPHNGGEKIDREAIEDDGKKLSVKETVELIELAQSEDEVKSIVGNDTRAGVLKAAEKQIASFQ